MTEQNQFSQNELNKKEEAQYIKSYMFIKGFAVGKHFRETQMALALAQRLHEGQHRKDGSPYLSHPLKVCSTLISCGIDDDATLAAALLHDVLEDSSDRLPGGGEDLVQVYGLSREVLELIERLTKCSGLDDSQLAVYFRNIQCCPKAALIKLSDRLHNSSTLYNFTLPKMRKYIRETAMFLVPMASYCKKYYPDYANAFGILKTGIDSMNHSMDVMLQKIEMLSASTAETTGD